MTCEQVQTSDLVERYLTNQLADADREQFEEHYFACDDCFDHLRAMKAARVALREAGVVPIRSRRRPPLWMLAAAAVVVLTSAGVLLFHKSSQEPQAAKQPLPAPNFELLAHIDPPAYSPAILRGNVNAAERRFRTAMEAYTTSDYPRAVEGLRDALKQDPGSLNARYFLGISELLTGDIESGQKDLRAVIAAGDHSPFLEEAHYYLGKAHLKTGQLREARAEFETVVRLHGDLQSKAQEIISQLTVQ